MFWYKTIIGTVCIWHIVNSWYTAEHWHRMLCMLCVARVLSFRVFVVPEQWRRLPVRTARAPTPPAARHCFGPLERLRLPGMQERRLRVNSYTYTKQIGCGRWSIHLYSYTIYKINSRINKLNYIFHRSTAHTRNCLIHLGFKNYKYTR